jgi:hypothetical protein
MTRAGPAKVGCVAFRKSPDDLGEPSAERLAWVELDSDLDLTCSFPPEELGIVRFVGPRPKLTENKPQ